MYRKIIIIFFLFLLTTECSKKEELSNKPPDERESYNIYKEGLEALNQGEYFFAARKFSEAEKILPVVEHSAKALLMSSFCYYTINFHEEAISSLESFLRKYPADENVQYASYLIILSNYEQILDEKKDLEPLLKTKKLIEAYVKNYPGTDYSLDLKFKLDLIQNQLAAKELFIAKYYISVQKWVPAINRLKVIVEDYEKTVFIEEALHRLVEINYYLGLEGEAKKFAKILGYNYNSSQWFEQTYKVLNKDYEIKKVEVKKDDNFFKKIIKKIR